METDFTTIFLIIFQIGFIKYVVGYDQMPYMYGIEWSKIKSGLHTVIITCLMGLKLSGRLRLTVGSMNSLPPVSK